MAASLLSGAAFAADGFYDRRSVTAADQATNNTPQRTLAAAQPAGAQRTMVLAGGRIFDAVSGQVVVGSLVIRHNRIAAILPAASSDWPQDATVIDVSGKTVMPGLIDMHVHTYSGNNPGRDVPKNHRTSEGYATLRGMRNLRYMLESGVTSARDMGGIHDAPTILSDWIEKNPGSAPRMFAAGHIITGTGGHAAERTSGTVDNPDIYVRQVNGADAWVGAVREMFKAGASHIKISSHFAPEEVRAAVDEAHRLGLKVTCDCETIYVQMAVAAGVDSIEHPLPRSDETIRLMARNGVGSIPTMYAYQRLFDAVGVYAGSTSRRFTMGSQQNFDLLKKMIAAGVPVGVGTDMMSDLYDNYPHFYLAELRFLVRAGYTPARALVAATRVNAQILDMGDKLGTLEPGKLADVLVVDGQPDRTLEDLLNVELVIRDGNVAIRDGRLFVPRHQSVSSEKFGPPDTLR